LADNLSINSPAGEPSDLAARISRDGAGGALRAAKRQFRRAAFEGRGSWWTDNLLERDRMFTERLREETGRLGLPAIEVETSMAENDLVERVARAFALPG